MFNWFQKTLPPMSQTERDAIDAGTVWWDGELFSGRPDWDKLLSYPKAQLSEEEQAFIDGPTEDTLRHGQRLADRPDHGPAARSLDITSRNNGFFALIIPKEFGGKGFSAYAHSQVAMKLATHSGDLASTVMVPNSLGPAELLLHYGTDEQRNHYLPRLARGDDIPCFALTGPLAGSDAGGMPDTGVICKGQWEGQEVLGLRLNWEKRYITLGPVATLLGLAFKAYDPDHLLGDKEDLGISLALIPTDTAGVEIGRRHLPLGAAFMNGPNSGKDVFVPLEFLIGGQEMLGKGWMMLMNCLSVGRSISLPAVGTGMAKFTSLVTGQYAQVREQFNVPTVRFRRHSGSHGAHRRQCLDDGRRPHADRQRGRSGRETVGAVGDSQVPPHRTRPRMHQPRHGCARRQGDHHGAEQLPRPQLERRADFHHRRRREHSLAQPDDLRPGRDSLPSLRAQGNGPRRP